MSRFNDRQALGGGQLPPAGQVTAPSVTPTPAPAPAPTPTVTLSAALTRNEGNSGGTAYVYTVTLSQAAPAGGVGVPWSFQPGTTDASDYVGGVLPTGGTVAIAAGATTGTVTITVAGDTVVEGAETFTVSITAPGGYAAGASMSATGTIVNDDAALTATPAATVVSAAAPDGSFVFSIGNATSQPTIVSPTDQRFAVASDVNGGWKVVTGLGARSAGSVNVVVSTAGEGSVTVPVTITQVTATPASNSVPAPVEGVIGGDSLYPQASVGKGPSAGVFMVGGGLANGNQVARVYDHATSALIETRTVRAIDGKDDHKGTCIAAYSSGAFTATATGHNNTTDFRVFFSDRAPDGTWTETTVTYPQRVTYPTQILDKNERLMFFIRCNNNTWTLRFRDGWGGQFGGMVTFATHPNQLYFQSPRYDPVTHRVYASLRVNDDEASESGRIKLIEFDCATGEWFDANGGLGKMDGTASANGKKLPFAYLDLAIQFDKAANAAYRIEDRSYDGRSMIVRTSIDAAQSPTGLDRNEVRVWRCPTGDRMNPANWSQGPLIYNMEKTTAGGPKCRFDVAPRPAGQYRFYGEKGIITGGDVNWQINRYDSTDNGATWTETLMEQSPMVIIHCNPIENAVATTPVAYLQYAAYVSFDTYTQTATRFFKPYAARAAPLLFDTFTDVSPDVDLNAHTPQIGGAWTRKAAVSSANPIKVSATQSRLYASTAVAAQYNNAAAIPASAKKVRATTKISVQGATDNTIATAIYADPTAYTCYSASVRKSTGAWGVNRVVNGTQQTVMSGTIPGGTVTNGDCLELEVETIDANTRRLTFIYNGVAYGTPYTDANAGALTGATTDVRISTATTTSGGGIAHDSLMVQVVE